MPTYVYRRADGSTFELFQSITADPLTTCPDTRQPVRRLITGGIGFIFKGTGFYQTDYVNKPADKSKNGEKTDKGEKAAKKPEAKESKTNKESKAALGAE